MRARISFVLLGVFAGLLVNAVVAVAWTGPTASAPNSNVAAPINVGTTAQVKNGDFGVNKFFGYDNALLSGLGVGTGRYLNFDYSSAGNLGTGAAGYGIRDTAGTLEFKNNGGSWASLQSLIAGTAGFWTATGNDISNSNTGNVGIGTASPGAKLTVAGSDIGITNPTGYAGIIFDGLHSKSAWIHFGGDATNEFRIARRADGFGAWEANVVNFDLDAPGSTFNIDGSGNVGLGAPSTGYKLDVNGNMRLTGPAIIGAPTGDAYAELGYGATANRNAYIDMIGDTTYTDYGARLIRYASGANSAVELLSRGTGGLYLTAQDAGPVVLKTANTNRIVIDSAGNVGVGNCGPMSLLSLCNSVASAYFDIRAPLASQSAIQFADTTNGADWVFYRVEGTRDLSFWNPTVGQTMRLTQAGNVGIGPITPGVKFEVQDGNGIKVGNAYMSSGGGYGHFGTNEYYNGSVWVTNGSAGGMIQVNPNQQMYYMTHTAAGAHAYGTINAASFLYTSDARFKNNVKDLDEGLLEIMKLRPVSFTWKKMDYAPGTGDDIGLIAQEVEKIIPGIVKTDDKGIKAIDYIKLTPILVKAIQEQQVRIDALEARISALELQGK